MLTTSQRNAGDRRSRSASKQVAFLYASGVVLLLWQITAACLHARVFPEPLVVLTRLWQMLWEGLPRHLAVSLLRVLGGITGSLLIGIPLGLLVSGRSRIAPILSPILYLAYPIPKTALLPIALLLFGLGESSKLLIMILTTLFPIIVAVRDAVQTISPTYDQIAASAGLSRIRILLDITIPATLPALMTAIRTGLGTSLAILLIVEAYGTRFGLGYLILDAWSRMDYPGMYGAIAALSILGAGCFYCLDRLACRLCPWMDVPSFDKLNCCQSK